MKALISRFLKSLPVLSLIILLIPIIPLITPTSAQAFGGLGENGTAAFMGIGITPTKILHVSGSGPGTVPLFVRGTDSAGFIIERTPTNRWVFGVNENPDLGNGFVLSTFPSGSGSSTPRLIVKQDGKVGIGTTNPLYKLQVDGGDYSAISASSTGGIAGFFGGDVHIAGKLEVGPTPAVSIGRIYKPTSGAIIATDNDSRLLYWDPDNDRIQLTNNSGDWCDYWWQTQKEHTTAGYAGSIPTGNTTAIITDIATNCDGIEVHFGQADGEKGWCSVWLQHVANKLVGHYIKY